MISAAWRYSNFCPGSARSNGPSRWPSGWLPGPKSTPELWVELACCYAQCARSLPPEKAEAARACQIKAVDAVRSAIRGGFRDKIALEIEPDLDPIRPRDDFQAVLREMPAAS